MENVTYREALRRALDEELGRDESVFLMGEEIGRFEGSYKVTAGLYAKYGPRRVRETPIAEEGFVGAGVGAAMLGLRPVVEVLLSLVLVTSLTSWMNLKYISSSIQYTVLGMLMIGAVVVPALSEKIQNSREIREERSHA